jgi:hypothetical protein
MARPLRIEKLGVGITSRLAATNAKPSFATIRTGGISFDLLCEMVLRFYVGMRSFVLMGKHYQLLLGLLELT